MRVHLPRPGVVLQPGSAARVPIEVTNSLGVIDGVSAAVTAPPGLTVHGQPDLLPLFPDTTGVITLVITAGTHFHAGSHELPVTIRSSVQPDRSVTVTLDLEVAPRPAAELEVVPPLRSGRSRARYQVVARNVGNTDLSFDLAADDMDRQARTALSGPLPTLGPAAEAVTGLRVRARRQLLGSGRRRVIDLVARDGDTEVSTTAVFAQRPVIPQGVRTIGVLAVVVCLWVVGILFGLSKAMSSDPLTKDVPASFYASDPGAAARTLSAVFGPHGSSLLRVTTIGAGLPAGALPKNSLVIGVGGTVSGTVDAANTGAGVGRITVQAMRFSTHGPVLVASAATAADGSYSLEGLLPGAYEIEFSATGYVTRWWPAATSMTTATPVSVQAQGTTAGIDATVAALPATVSGNVVTGMSPSAPVTVTLTGQQGAKPFTATTTTDPTGAYSFTGVPAPGTYDLAFSAPGYQVGSDTETVAGGEQHIDTTVTLVAGTGTLGGTVTSAGQPVGGVTITADANGRTFTTATPTTGAVGQFTIPNLPTPATYLLTLSKTGYGTTTVAEHLGPGQTVANLTIPLGGGAGEVSGRVTSTSGAPLGGVTVTVDGGTNPTTTQTLTAGSVGDYLLSGLATPGSYTLTFSDPGYQSVTVGVTLTSSGSASNIDARLPPGAGQIAGAVTLAGAGSDGGVTVTATNGSTTATTTTATTPAGAFTLSGLAPGSWSVTFSISGYAPQTVLVHLAAGRTQTADVTLVRTSGV